MSITLHPLFVYGTLKDEEICELLFKEKISSNPAILHNYSIKKSSDFFFIVSCDKSKIEGKVIYLTDKQLLIADQWEEIPFYSRKKIDIYVFQKKIQAWVYIRENVEGEDADVSQLCSIDRNELIKLVTSFNRQLEINTLPYTDAYLMVPCIIDTRKIKYYENNLEFETNFIKKIKDISYNEFSGNIGNQINRFYFPQIEIAAYSCDDTEILGFEKASIVISEFNKTGFAVIYIIVPAVSVPLIYLLDQASSGRIRVRELEEKIFIPINEYFSSKGITISGTIRTALFMIAHPSKNDFISTLICEAESPAEITSNRISFELNNNIAQYSSAEIYASDICIIEIPNHFDLLYENRLNGQLLTLFILELIQLQEAALKKISQDIFSMITNKKYKSDTNALKEIEEITEEYSKAMLLWNINNFRYRTAQSLADEFSSKFKMEKRFEELFQYKSLIQQLTSMHADRINITDSKILNTVLLVLAFIQIAPILNNVFQLIITSKFILNDVITSMTSIISCYMIWLIFKFINKNSK